MQIFPKSPLTMIHTANLHCWIAMQVSLYDVQSVINLQINTPKDYVAHTMAFEDVVKDHMKPNMTPRILV